MDYMAPEVLMMVEEEEEEEFQDGELPYKPLPFYDEKVDIWAVGAIAYELIAGNIGLVRYI